MKKLILSFKLLLVSPILLRTLSTYGMENHEQLARQAEIYNHNHSLPSLPRDVLLSIFYYLTRDYQRHCYDCSRRRSCDQIDALEDTMNDFIQLSSICKNFKNLLTIKTIGGLCKHYELVHKNRAIKNLLKKFITSDKYEFYGHYGDDRFIPRRDMYDTYSCYNENRRLFALILICAGADPDIVYTEISEKKSDHGRSVYINSPSLLECATRQSDTQLVKILFEHHADPNENKLIEYLDYMNMKPIQPVFFHAKTTEIAQIFIDNLVYLHTVDSDSIPNVLWKTIENDYPSSLMKLYLDYHVNATRLDSDGNCLLHRLACPLEPITNIDNFLQKCELLLTAIANEMINTLSKHKETPLDWAKRSFKEVKEKKAMPEKIKAFKTLIKVFKKRGSLSGKALLRQQKTTSFLHITSNNNFRKK